MNGSVDNAFAMKLRTLYESNDTVVAILKLMSRRQNDPSETPVERAASQIGIPYYDVVGAMKALATAGAGDFIAGRRGGKTRIRWNYSARSLAAVAQGEGEPIDLDPNATPEHVNADQALLIAPLPEGFVTHAFLLRPGVRITIALPEDLTEREADRLAGFVKALPYAAEDW